MLHFALGYDFLRTYGRNNLFPTQQAQSSLKNFRRQEDSTTRSESGARRSRKRYFFWPYCWCLRLSDFLDIGIYIVLLSLQIIAYIPVGLVFTSPLIK